MSVLYMGRLGYIYIYEEDKMIFNAKGQMILLQIEKKNDHSRYSKQIRFQKHQNQFQTFVFL